LLGFVHIVDDDTSFRIAMMRRLKKAGYEVAIYRRRRICLIGYRPKVNQAAFCSTCGYEADLRLRNARDDRPLPRE